MTTITITELKTECYNALGQEAAKRQARAIASELSTATQQITLSNKVVWTTLHSKVQSEQPVSFAQVCATVEREENPFLAMLLVSAWLFSQWLSLLLWLAPRAIRAGQITRQWAIALANGYTRVSYRLIHGCEFPNSLPATPEVTEAIAHIHREVLPKFRAELKAETVSCLVYSREFYLRSAIKLLSLLQEIDHSSTRLKTA
ncbi:hypothetical protein [Synechococcus sp. PCC 7335]|uniref:hypothetical protein n=1 Tax=Synechococcus sp. (strain ATCC 29403 / PCC 7335) TaxID=91464 RepID=UPI00030ACA73|nr:hypothetical protein [Synechococcus sp. PCC 7335]